MKAVRLGILGVYGAGLIVMLVWRPHDPAPEARLSAIYYLQVASPAAGDTGGEVFAPDVLILQAVAWSLLCGSVFLLADPRRTAAWRWALIVLVSYSLSNLVTCFGIWTLFGPVALLGPFISTPIAWERPLAVPFLINTCVGLVAGILALARWTRTYRA